MTGPPADCVDFSANAVNLSHVSVILVFIEKPGGQTPVASDPPPDGAEFDRFDGVCNKKLRRGLSWRSLMGTTGGSHGRGGQERGRDRAARQKRPRHGA